MAGYVPYGDAEAAACAIIRGDPNVTDLGAVVVTTDLIGYTRGKRWVRVVRTGGVPTWWMLLDNPVLTVDVYAPDKAAAYDLTDAVRGALFTARGVYTGNGLHLYDVTDATGVTWAPDEEAGPRYTFGLLLVTRPEVT